jgi:epoxyqueuosine reductase QueG
MSLTTESKITSEVFKKAAFNAGADLVGIASIDRFDGLPKEMDPKQIFPEAASVIVLAKRIPRGALRGVEEGTQFGLYRHYGYDWLEDRFLALTTYRVAEFLEDNGFEAVPLPHIPPEVPPLGIPISDDKPAPNVLLDFNDAAVRAGMGELDYTGLLLTPEFGPRQRIQVILTEAELGPDPVHKDPICTCSAQEYASFCPLKAIDPEKKQTIEICGKKMTRLNIDYRLCNDCKNGAGRNRYYPAAHPDRLAALCTRSLIDYLEKNGNLKNRFKNRFRKRAAWNIRDGQTYLEHGSDIE